MAQTYSQVNKKNSNSKRTRKKNQSLIAISQRTEGSDDDQKERREYR
jgi:hypothetical protein